MCNRNGQIEEVIFDELNLVPKNQLPVPLFDILDSESMSKAAGFWSEVQSREFVREYELLVARGNQLSLPLKFTAGTFNNRVWVIAAQSEKGLNEMLDELMLINNEQQNIIRRTEKKLSQTGQYAGTQSFDSYDEITRMNNELVNVQRQLIKKNEEINRLNNELKQSNKELEHFAHSISHDLKEPLRMVTSFLKLLNQRYSGQLDEKADKYIHFAVDGAGRMKVLIDDLLEFSRVGRVNSTYEKTDLNHVLENVMKLLEHIIKEQNADVNWNHLPEIRCQTMPMQQLFANLISNSIKYRKEDEQPVVNIDYKEKANQWLFSVQDNGIGINSEFHSAVFEVFRRIDTNSDVSGTGMGLAICKKIVEEHGGKIWVESEEGEGSTFIFTIKKL